MHLPGEQPHRRYNPLTDEWVLVSAHRTERPWLGQEEPAGGIVSPEHDPTCYLCPGTLRATGEANPEYDATYVFTNDYPALLPESGGSEGNHEDDLFNWSETSGTSRVICYSPRHDLTLPKMSIPQIENVVKTWIQQSEELGKIYKWVQIFENKGSAMGASNPHPHGQLWAGDFVPTTVAKEGVCQQKYFTKHGSSLLLDYVSREVEADIRVVCKNKNWLVVVPFWATWPYETLVLPRQPISRMQDISDSQKHDLALILKQFLTKYDLLFNTSFPYSMGWHGAPNGEDDVDHWLLHAHFYPPLLRSATVRKFLVGYEMLAEAQRDLTPESAAQRLKCLPEKFSS